MTRRESQPQSESFIGLLGDLFDSAKAKHNMKNRKVQLLCARMLCLALNEHSLEPLSPKEPFPLGSPKNRDAQQQVLEPLQAATRWDDTLAAVEAGEYGTKKGAQENPLLTYEEVGLLGEARVYVSSLASSTKACLQNISAKWLSMANKAAFISHFQLLCLKGVANTEFGEMIQIGSEEMEKPNLCLEDKILICELRSLIIQATTDNSAVSKRLTLDSCHKEKVNREIEILEEALAKQQQAPAAASPLCPGEAGVASSAGALFSATGSDSGSGPDSDGGYFYDAEGGVGREECGAIVARTMRDVGDAVSEGDSKKLKELISSLVDELPLTVDECFSIENYAQLLSDVAEIVPGSCPDAGVIDLQATAAEFSGFCAEIKAWKTEEGQGWINRYSACVDITPWEPSDAPDWLTKMQQAQDGGCSGSLTVAQVDCLLGFAASAESDRSQLDEQLGVRSPGMS